MQVLSFDKTAGDNARHKVRRAQLTPGKWSVVRVRYADLWFWSSGEGVPAGVVGHKFNTLHIASSGEAAIDEVCVFEEE